MKGNKTYRHAENPEEKRFHDEAVNMGTSQLSAMTLPMNDTGIAPKGYLNKEEEIIVINTLQWLGSPVGQRFLRGMGYEKDENPQKPTCEIVKKMTDKDRRHVVKRCIRRGSLFLWSWKELDEVQQDRRIEEDCKRIGFTLAEFYDADGRFLNKILKR